jgi:hypothetical protein
MSPYLVSENVTPQPLFNKHSIAHNGEIQG